MYQNPSSLDTDLQNENDPQKSGELSSNFERAEFVSKTPEKIHPFAEKPVKSSTKKTSGDQLSDQVNDMELKMDKMQKQIDEINLKHSKQKDGLEEKHSPLRVSFFYDLLSSTAELQNSDFCVRTAKEKGNPLIRIIEEALKYTSSVPQAISNYVQEHEKDIEKKTQARIESAFSQHQYSRPNITTIAENKMDLETSKGKGRSEKGVSEFEDDSTRPFPDSAGVENSKKRTHIPRPPGRKFEIPISYDENPLKDIHHDDIWNKKGGQNPQRKF